jgi:hypothetical protein
MTEGKNMSHSGEKRLIEKQDKSGELRSERRGRKKKENV